MPQLGGGGGPGAVVVVVVSVVDVVVESLGGFVVSPAIPGDAGNFQLFDIPEGSSYFLRDGIEYSWQSARALTLCEAAPTVRAGLAARFAGQSKIKVCSPEEVAALPAGSLDVVVLHSVAQYLTPQELDALLVLFRRLLSENGILILGDVVPPEVSAWTDAVALIRFGAANGFLGATLIGLLRTLVSDYWRLRFDLGLSRYGEAAMLAKLAAAGFSARRAAANIGHNQARMTFIARRA